MSPSIKSRKFINNVKQYIFVAKDNLSLRGRNSVCYTQFKLVQLTGNLNAITLFFYHNFWRSHIANINRNKMSPYYCSNETCSLSSQTQFTAAVGAVWTLLGLAGQYKVTLHVFQKHLLSEEYIYGVSYC
jgi:hypothetical protein